MRKVPELSLLSYVNGSTSDQLKFVDNISSGLKNYGFIVLKDHTIDQKKIDRAYELVQELKPSWTYVKGHSGDKYNDRVDEIATSFADNDPVELIK